MVKVGFDISQSVHQGGVAVYTQNLAEHLQQIKDLEMVYFFSSLRKKAPPFTGGNIKKFRLPPSFFELLFNRWRNVPIEKFIGPVDIFHSSDWTQPKTKALKVTTYHDLIPIKYPKWSHPKIIEVHKRRLKIVEKEIDMVIAVSETTKKDLMEFSNIPEEKIKVIYEASLIDIKPRSAEKIAAFKSKYNLADNFILAIGGIGERRNLKRIKMACQGFNLVIAGQTIPWLEKSEIELLYHSADILLYCSLYEGFGLPILDAFSAGLPVVTSDVSSMPEVAAEAAVYVDPYNVEDIKEKVKRLMENKDLREDLIKKGFEQVKKFSWERTANETANVYRGLINR